jgi:peptide/nickel transport system substrate-binding protein
LGFADDLMFGMVDVQMHPDISPAGYAMLKAGGKHAEIMKIDDYTVRFEFAVPKPGFITVMTGPRTWGQHMTLPKHYLQKWHPKYNPDAEKLAREEDFETWADAMNWHKIIYAGQNDLDMPRVDAFIVTEHTPTRMVFERNPYYFKVDPEGNQLPYLDGMVMDVVSNAELVTLKVLNGEVDRAHHHHQRYLRWGPGDRRGAARHQVPPGLLHGHRS